MTPYKPIISIVGFCWLVLFLVACGPSQAALSSTATVAAAELFSTQTAGAPTSTPTATLTPTQMPTPTATPTPTPEPDAKAMIAWRELGFSKEFIAFPPSVMGIEEGANAFSLNAGDGSILQYTIAGSFVFADSENPTQIIYGYTALLPSSKGTDAFDEFSQSGLTDLIVSGFGVPVASVSSLANTNDIGNSSGGATTQISRNGTTWQVSMVAFRVGGIGSLVIVRNKSDVESPISVDQVARVYAKSIQIPAKYCSITSVSPVENALVPTFKFEAEGFYPQEGRYILLEGNILLGNETKTAKTGKAGLNGETVDKDGHLADTVSFFSIEQLKEQGAELPSGPTEYTLTVGGHASGCEVDQTVSWPGSLTTTATP